MAVVGEQQWQWSVLTSNTTVVEHANRGSRAYFLRSVELKAVAVVDILTTAAIFTAVYVY